MQRLAVCALVFFALDAAYADQALFASLKTKQETFARIRQELHQIPELKFKEVKTSAYIASYLKKLGLDVKTSIGGSTGLSALLDSGKPGKTVAIRAEMDGLPITEESSLPYKSKHIGIMHACGHDGHMTSVLMAAAILSENKDKWRGRIKFIFQPGEESGGGAKVLVEAGILENPQVNAIFGLHNWPLPKGDIATRVGTLLASSDHFELTLTGKGGHAALPHLTKNPIIVGAQIINNLQALVSQKDPTDAAVLNFGAFQSGTATNVIPDTAVIKGTFRTVSAATREHFKNRVESIVNSMSASMDVKANMEYVSAGYPPTVNHKLGTDIVVKSAREVLNNDKVYYLEHPVMPAEDFAFYLERVPGAFFFVGNGDDKPAPHTVGFNFEDDILPIAAYVLARSAMTYLAEF